MKTTIAYRSATTTIMSSKPKKRNNNSTMQARAAESSELLPHNRAAPAAAASTSAIRTTQGDAVAVAATTVTNIIEKAPVATHEPDAASSLISNKRASATIHSAEQQYLALVTNSNKNTQADKIDRNKMTKSEANTKARDDWVGCGREKTARDAENLRCTLLEIRATLNDLAVHTEATGSARNAAADVIRAITVMLRQAPIDNSPQSYCQRNHNELLEELDEDLGEHFGVWQWAWLYEHEDVQYNALEFLSWLLTYVPVGFADMCDSTAHHLNARAPLTATQPPKTTTFDEGATDVREQLCVSMFTDDNEPIEYQSAVVVQNATRCRHASGRRRRRRQRK